MKGFVMNPVSGDPVNYGKEIIISTVANTQYKTVGVQWFAWLWFPHQRLTRWKQTRSENPTVSYCKTLVTKHRKIHYYENICLFILTDFDYFFCKL